MQDRKMNMNTVHSMNIAEKTETTSSKMDEI